MLLEHGGKTEVSDLLELHHVKPDMILRRIPYNLEIRPLKAPYYRTIGLVFKDRKKLTPAVRKFIEIYKANFGSLL